MSGPVGGKRNYTGGGREKNSAGRSTTNTCLLFLWIWAIIPLNFAMNKTLCCTAGEEPSHRERRGFRCTLDIMSVLCHWGVGGQKKSTLFAWCCIFMRPLSPLGTMRSNKKIEITSGSRGTQPALTEAGWARPVSGSSMRSPGSWTCRWRRCHRRAWWWRRIGPRGRLGRRRPGTRWGWCSPGRSWSSAGCRPRPPKRGWPPSWCTSRTSWRTCASPPVLCPWPKETHGDRYGFCSHAGKFGLSHHFWHRHDKQWWTRPNTLNSYKCYISSLFPPLLWELLWKYLTTLTLVQSWVGFLFSCTLFITT